MSFYFELAPEDIAMFTDMSVPQIMDAIVLVDSFRKRNPVKFADIIIKNPALYRLECARLRHRAESKTKNVPQYFGNTEKPVYLFLQ